MIKRLAILPILALLSLCSFAQSDCFPTRNDSGSQLVYDQTDLLSQDYEGNLNSQLVSFAQKTSNQIVVVIVDDLCGKVPNEYATELGHSWGVGQGNFDNGVVLLIKPTGGAGERHTHIAVGYGLEGVITDASAYRIVQNQLLPNFRNGQFEAGITLAIATLMGLAEGEINQVIAVDNGASEKGLLKLLIKVVPFLLIFFFFFFKRVRSYQKDNSVSFWAAFWLMSSATSSSRGSYGHFSSGSGGFGGFGGGGFGGGGAGGSW